MDERNDYNSIPMQSNKTAMQELIDNLESIDINVPNGVKLIFIEKEKEQIMDAFLNGKVNHSKLWSEEYYNQTYQPKSEVK